MIENSINLCFNLCCCFFFFFLAREILTPQLEIEPVPPGVDYRSPNHWTTLGDHHQSLLLNLGYLWFDIHLPHSGWRRSRYFGSPEGSHWWTQGSGTGALTLLSRMSCPPGMGERRVVKQEWKKDLHRWHIFFCHQHHRYRHADRNRNLHTTVTPDLL